MPVTLRHLPIQRSAVALTLATAAMASQIPDARAQSFPSKPIHVIVATAPGDPGDTTARLIQQRMSERLGQQWVVETRPGASGKIASQFVARSDPDGHTLLVVLSAHAINPSGQGKLAYDTKTDFAGVSLVARQPLIAVVNPSVKGATLKEFIAAAQAGQQGKLSFSSPGTGTLSYLLGEQISRLTKVDMPHVPFRGGSPAIQAVVANDVQLCVLIPAILFPMIRAGKLRALAVTSPQRMPQLPDVPTMTESGIDTPPVYNWIGFFAPGATPRPIVERLSKEIAEAVQLPEAKTWFAKTGFEIIASKPQELDAFVSSEIDRWRKFTKEYNIKFQ